MLLLHGTPTRAVMGIMGWSNPAMAKNYQHMTSRIRADIAKQVDVLLWGITPSVDEDGGGDAISETLIPA